MMMNAETSRSAMFYSACVADDLNSKKANLPTLMEAAAIAKAHCSSAVFENAATAIQLHGGTGFTWEYPAHLYFKRAKSSQLMLGNESYQYEQLATSLLDEDHRAGGPVAYSF